VQSFELDAMCQQFDREDIIQIYMVRGPCPCNFEAHELLNNTFSTSQSGVSHVHENQGC
jgi:hypothetical protein